MLATIGWCVFGVVVGAALGFGVAWLRGLW